MSAGSTGPAASPVGAAVDTPAETPVDEAHLEACAACAHPLGDHDDLGRRFCAATEVGAIPRACICRPRGRTDRGAR